MTTPPAPDNDVPFYLMPVAAVLGMYAFVGFMRTFYSVIFRAKSQEKSHNKQRRTATTTTAQADETSNFAKSVASWVVAAIAYSFVVAKIERAYAAADYALFDPYEILGIGEGTTNVTVIKKAYRDLAKIHHPDKSDGTLFLRLSKAYDALTDEAGKRNYLAYGHPDGPLSTPAFQLALPTWLLFPDDRIAVVMLVLYMVMLLGLILYIIQQLSYKLPDELPEKVSLLDQTNSVSVEDLSFLANTLKPTSTHLEILYAVITSPENIEWSLQDLERVEQTRLKRLQQDKDTPKAAADFDDLFNEGGWDEDAEDDDAAKAEKAAEEERKKEMERLKQATGKAVTLLEGLDDGVLGQKWVEKTLEEKGVWPPEFAPIEGATYMHEGQELTALEHPGVRRILCMTVGRLNSMMLNSHPQLLQAGADKKIDQTYFQASMQFRQRVGMLLEASLRVGMAMRSQRLVGTIVETVAMFKIGVKHDAVPWFNGLMTRQYGILPRLKILESSVSTPDEKEICTGDSAEVSLDLERIHAENFTKQKVEVFKKQGIPPQVGLQSYREGWWFMLRVERLDGPTLATPIQTDEGFLNSIALEPASLERFEKEANDYKLLTAWPLIIQHVSQQKGKVKVQFKAPDVPGKYRYYVSIKSQDFLGADQELKFNVNVVDLASVVRTPKKKEIEDAEPKKDK